MFGDLRHYFAKPRGIRVHRPTLDNRIRELAPQLATAILVACAVLVTIAVIRSSFLLDNANRTSANQTRTERNWEQYLIGGLSIGPRDAPVTIVAFSDYQCPFCRRFAQFHDSLGKLGVNVKVIYRHFPVPSHSHSVPAALASECAAQQGRFESMHANLFARSDSFGILKWWDYASRSGVTDSIAFDRCMNDPIPNLALAADTSAGHRLRVGGTPTLLIHELRVDGLPTFDSLLAYVNRASRSQ